MFDHPSYLSPCWLARAQSCCIGVLLWQSAAWLPVTAAPALGCSARNSEVTAMIRFQAGSTALDTPSSKRLGGIVSRAKDQPDTAFVIEGFAGKAKVSPEYALALGDKYAQTVRQQLLDSAIAPERINVLSLGQNGPTSVGPGACLRWQPSTAPQGAAN